MYMILATEAKLLQDAMLKSCISASTTYMSSYIEEVSSNSGELDSETDWVWQLHVGQQAICCLITDVKDNEVALTLLDASKYCNLQDMQDAGFISKTSMIQVKTAS